MIPIHQSRIQPEMFVHPSSGATPTRKAVSFESSPTKVVVLPGTDEDELRSKWYSKQEYAEFKESMMKSISAIDAGNSGDANVYCRGLEFMTPSGLAHRKQTKLKVLSAVWNGQVRQWNEKNRIYDPVTIALACQQETLQCVQMAWALGQLDQQAAMEEYQSMLFSNQINQSSNYSGGALQNQSNNCSRGALQNQSNSYIGGTSHSQSNNYIGGDLQKGAGKRSFSLSSQANITSGEDLQKCPVKSVTLIGKRTSKSSLDGSSHGLQSPAKKLLKCNGRVDHKFWGNV